jgi:hypothetical protein
MYDKIKQIADNAVAIQNKVGMEESLKEVPVARQVKPAAKKEGND